MNKLGLVTVLYNSDDVLEGFFKSVASQSYTDYVLYIVDNSPSSATRSLLKQLNTQFKITGITHIENEINTGVAAANNTGIKKAFEDGCTDFIILNNDIVFEDVNTFATLVDIANNNIADIIAPKIYYYGTKKIWYAGGSFNKWKGGIKHFGDRQEDKGLYDKPAYVSYAPTCFVYIKGEVFKKTGLMDETYFVYCDDLDFMYRALQHGFRLYYLPNPFIFHKISSSTGGTLSAFGIYYVTRNRIFFVRKFLRAPVKPIALFYTWFSLSVLLLISHKRNLIKKLNAGFADGFKLKAK